MIFLFKLELSHDIKFTEFFADGTEKIASFL